MPPVGPAAVIVHVLMFVMMWTICYYAKSVLWCAAALCCGAALWSYSTMSGHGSSSNKLPNRPRWRATIRHKLCYVLPHDVLAVEIHLRANLHGKNWGAFFHSRSFEFMFVE